MRHSLSVFEIQELFRAQGMPLLQIKEYREYGCCLCQQWHAEDRDPVLFDAHLYHQSNHGWRYTGRFYYKAAE